MIVRRMILFIFIGWMVLPLLGFGQEVYRWVDEKGTVHFVDDLSLVPEKYREQVQKKRPPEKPTSLPSPGGSEGSEVKEKSESAPERKDLLGRGEEWWRAKVKEWNDKFVSAQKNFDATFTEWKAKEKELEESKFKPDSFKRKLKADIKALEEKSKEWEQKREEAKNMLEKVLPKQAQDYRADPDWLKPKE
jgi:hypothetical protein